MASAEYIAAAKQANRQPTTYMSVEDASGETLYYTSQGQWDGSDPLSNTNTTEDPGSLTQERFTVSPSLSLPLGTLGYGLSAFVLTYDSALQSVYASVLSNIFSSANPRMRLRIFDDLTTPSVDVYSDEVIGSLKSGDFNYEWTYPVEFRTTASSQLTSGSIYYASVEVFYLGTWQPSWFFFSGLDPSIAAPTFDLLKPTAQAVTSGIDFGADTSENPIFSADDITEAGSTITYSYSYATAAAPTTFTSGGTIVDGDSIVSGAQYYKIQIDFTTTTGGRGKVREIQLKEGIFRYYGSHIGEPFDGVSPQIIPDSVSSFSQKIKIDKGLSTTGEASVRLFWVPETSDLIASGYLKGKDVAIYSGFVGLDTASYEPIITGTWYDHDLDEVNGIITVKIRDAFKQFEKRKIPEEVVNTTTGAITTTPLTYTTTSLVTVMKDIFDNIGLRDRYISPDFDTLESGDYAAAKYKVSRIISKPQDFSKLLDELAITGSMFLIPLGNGQIKPKPFDINQEHIAILDADEVKFTGLKGNISEFYSRFYAYYNPKTTLTDDPDDDRDDYDNATALIDANAELKWFPERGTKEHFDKWKVGRTSASTALTAPPQALNDLAGQWNSLFTEPLYTVKAANLGPRYADIEPADVVQVDNLRLPVVDDVWIDAASYKGSSFSISSQSVNVEDIFFSPDGLIMYIINDSSGDEVFQYSLSSAWDITTASYNSKFYSFTTEETAPTGLYLRADGLKLYTVGTTNDLVYQYSMSTPWDVTTLSYDSISFSVPNPQGVFFKSDGLLMYVATNAGNAIVQYALSTAWDVSTSVQTGVLSATPASNIKGVNLSEDGRILFIVSSDGAVYRYNVGTAWNISTANYSGDSISTIAEDSIPTGVFFKQDGFDFFICGSATNAIYRYSMISEWEIASTDYTEGDRVIHDGKMWRARQDNSGKDPTSEATFWQDMEINADGYTNGKHFFVLGRKFNPNTAQIDLDLMEMPPGTLGAFSADEFSTAFDI